MALNLPKKPKQSFWDKVRDVVDANSQMDQYKRAQAGQPLDYASQQRALGNSRPMMNIGQQVVGNTARFLNTAAGAISVIPETIRGEVAMRTGNQNALQASLARQKAMNEQAFNPTGGLLRAGTIYNSPQEFGGISNAETIKRVGLNTIGTAGEVLPFAKVGRPIEATGKIALVGNRLQTGSKLIKGIQAAETSSKLLPKVAFNAGQNVLTGAGTSAAGQYIESGKINPKRLAGDVASSVLLGATGDVATSALGKRVGKVLSKPASTLDPAADLVAQRKRYQIQFDRETNPTRRRQISQGIADLNAQIREARSLNQGGYIKNPLANDAPQGKTPEEFYLQDIQRLENKYGKIHKSDPDRNLARLADKYFNELDPETQRFLEFQATGTDFESATTPQYRGFANADPNSSGASVHGSQIYELRHAVDDIRSQSAPPQKPTVTSKKPTTTQVSSIAQGRAVEAPVQPQVKIKETRLGKRVEEQGLTPELTKAIQDETPTYKTAKLKEVTAISKQTIGERLKSDPDGAFNEALTKVKGEMSIQDGSDIVEAIRHFDNAGDTVKSQTLYDLAAEKFSKKGQELNAAKLFYSMTPQGIANKFVRDIEAKTGKPVDPIVKSKLDSLIERMKSTNPDSYDAGLLRQQIETLKGKTIGSPWYKKLTSIWKSGLLTSPSTVSGNFIGNSAETIYKVGYVDPLATLMDGVASLFTGKRSKVFTGKGNVAGAIEGTKGAFKYFKTGYDPRRVNTDYSKSIYFSDSPLGKAAETYTGTVMKIMGAGDQPFYYAHFRNSLHDQALAEGINTGLKGKELSKFATDLSANPSDKMLQTATNEALYYTFNNPTKLSEMAGKVQEIFPVGGEVLIPFSTVPSSIATRLIQRNPVGLAFRIAKEIKNVAKDGKPFNQRSFVQDIAESTAALPLFVGGAVLAKSGAITLGYPKDQTEQKQWELENKQPYSVKVGDRWYSLNYVQPFAAILAIGGGFEKAKSEGMTDQEAMGVALAEGGKAFTEQSFLRGINQANAAITSPIESAGALAESYASSVIPNVVRRIASATDTAQGREVDGIKQAVQSAIPGQRQKLEARTNQYGEVIPNSMGPNKGVGSVIEGLVSPFKARDISKDPVVEELSRLDKAGFTAVPSVVQTNYLGDGTKLTPEERRAIENATGPLVKTAHAQIMGTDQYKSMSDEDKQKVLREATNKIRRAYVKGEEIPPVESFIPKEKTVVPKKTTTKKTKTSSSSRGRSSSINALQFLSGAPRSNASVRPTVRATGASGVRYQVRGKKAGAKPKVSIRRSKV